MDTAVNPITKLWVNGAAVPVDGATLEIDPNGGTWRVRAALGRRDPLRQQFGLSMQLADGRTAHGRARLVEAGGEVALFEGSERLDGAL